jgi:hypothetical protein
MGIYGWCGHGIFRASEINSCEQRETEYTFHIRGTLLMSDTHLESGDQTADEVSARRDFLKKSARVAVAVPAAALLLSVQSKSALAQAAPYGNPPPS